jgi:hypothetical protein
MPLRIPEGDDVGEPTGTTPAAAPVLDTTAPAVPLEEYARDRLKDVLGKEVSRGARVLTAGVLGYAASHALPLNATDHAMIAAGIQAAATAVPVVAGILLRRLGASQVQAKPKSAFWNYFQKAVAWLPI